MNVILYPRVSTAKQGQSGLGLEAQQKITHDYLERRHIMTKYVIYRRLSKESKTRGNLGLEAQQMSIESFLKANHDHKITANLMEIESGTRKGNDRPVLKEALQLCKQTDSVLLIATLSRLSRNVHFISGLMESGVEFVAIDMPVFNKTMLYVAAAFAEQEADYISQRTKAAIAEAKKHGKKLGNPQNFTSEHRRLGALSVNKKKKTVADAFALKMYPTISYLRNKGYSVYQVAQELNDTKYPTASGIIGKWDVTKVKQCLKRVENSIAIMHKETTHV